MRHANPCVLTHLFVAVSLVVQIEGVRIEDSDIEQDLNLSGFTRDGDNPVGKGYPDQQSAQGPTNSTALMPTSIHRIENKYTEKAATSSTSQGHSSTLEIGSTLRRHGGHVYLERALTALQNEPTPCKETPSFLQQQFHGLEVGGHTGGRWSADLDKIHASWRYNENDKLQGVELSKGHIVVGSGIHARVTGTHCKPRLTNDTEVGLKVPQIKVSDNETEDLKSFRVVQDCETMETSWVFDLSTPEIEDGIQMEYLLKWQLLHQPRPYWLTWRDLFGAAVDRGSIAGGEQMTVIDYNGQIRMSDTKSWYVLDFRYKNPTAPHWVNVSLDRQHVLLEGNPLVELPNVTKTPPPLPEGEEPPHADLRGESVPVRWQPANLIGGDRHLNVDPNSTKLRENGKIVLDVPKIVPSEDSTMHNDSDVHRVSLEQYKRYAAFYGAQVVKLGDPFNFAGHCTPGRRYLRNHGVVVQTYSIGKQYGPKFQQYGPSGIYLETHDAPHIWAKLTPESGGYILLGKETKIAGDAMKRTSRMQVTAFHPPYGYALIKGATTLHNDGWLYGEFMVTLGGVGVGDQDNKPNVNFLKQTVGGFLHNVVLKSTWTDALLNLPDFVAKDDCGQLQCEEQAKDNDDLKDTLLTTALMRQRGARLEGGKWRQDLMNEGPQTPENPSFEGNSMDTDAV